jgi:formylglycine-generating enzyme required for sulfatase activity
MVCIPGATFVMGSTITGSSFHEVTLKAFQIMTHEVTVAEYDACAIAGGCSSAGIAGSDTWTMDCNEGVPGREKHPINCVNWNNASAYCKWKGWRLLTEEEWQYAATRGGVRLFPWGNALPDASRLNIAGEEWGAVSWGNDNYLYTAPVGSFPLGATEDGIFDLGGNVWEMVSSHLCDYPKSACNNCPLGESCLNSCDANACATDQFVHRGGAWSEGPEWSPQNGGSWTNWRGGHPPTFYTSYVGFRCGRSVP